jgi:hypothetical protein
MSTSKFLTVPTTGKTTLVSAISASTGATDANKIFMTNASGQIDASFMPPGVEIQVETANATEDLTSGNFVNIYDNGGTPGVRKAIANDVNKIANGFVLTSTLTGASATIFTKGVNTALASVEGSIYYLSATTSGLGTVTPPAQSVGNFQQTLGIGVPSGVLFEFDPVIYFG